MGSQVSASLTLVSKLDTDSMISYHHNMFERHHRFIGWLGLAVRPPSSSVYIDTYTRLEHLDIRDIGKHLRYTTSAVESQRQYST